MRFWWRAETWGHEARSDCDSIALAIPPEGLVAWGAAYEGGQMLAVYTRGGNFMGRVLDVGRLLWQLLPELAARVRSARLPFQGRLTFRTDEGEAAIVITADDVLVDGGANGGLLVELPQTALARLCLGGFDPGGRAGAPAEPAGPGGGGSAARALPAADAAHLPDGPILRGTYFCCLRACLA